jgi:hypothetical protein
MRITTKQAVQAHPVPNRVTAPHGPFPPELTVGNPLSEPEIVYDYQPAISEDGSDFLPGATAQNNYRPPRYLRCSLCSARVLDKETEYHVCEE